MVAAALAAVVVASLASSLHPAPPPSSVVLVAAHDLVPGHALSDSDLTTAARPDNAIPVDAERDVVATQGRTVAAPVRAGEVVRIRDLLSPGLVTGLGQGMRATPIRLADPEIATLARPGDNVDVLAATGDVTTTTSAAVVARGVRVLAAPSAGGAASTGVLGGTGSTQSGAVLVLATTEQQALDLARASAASHLTITVRPG